MILIHHSPKFEIDLPFDIPDWMESVLFNPKLKYSKTIVTQVDFIKTWLKSQQFLDSELKQELLSDLDHRITPTCKLIQC